jgi:predicted PurR-regulated permease PerM
VVESPDDLKQMITEQLNQWGGAATKLMVELAKGIPDNLMQMALAALACFFIVMDGGRLVSWIGSLIPLAPQIREKLANSFKNTAISVVWASMAAAAAQALLMGIAYLVTGVPAAALAAAATFIFAWIPLLGCVPVWISGLIYLYAQGNITALVILIVFGAITGVLDNVVRPWVLRGRGEMHPLVSLVAIFGGLKMFGIMGVFFGPIMVASLLTLLQVWPTVATEEGIAL